MSVFERVRARLNAARRAAAESRGKTVRNFRGGIVDVQLDDGGTIEWSRTLATMGYRRSISEAMADEISLGLLDLTKTHAYRFRWRGNLYNSIARVKWGTGRYIIDSTLPYKATWIQTENQGHPSGSADSDSGGRIRDWMQSRRIGAGEKEWRKKQIAFAIAKGVREGTAGPYAESSRLRNLGGGARMYNYPERAVQEITPVLSKLGIAVSEVLRP